MNWPTTIALTCMAVAIGNVAVAELPAEFDWRYMKVGTEYKSYMTPVRNQGACGSCWAFAAVGVVEAEYEIFWNWPEYDADLSEENLVCDCFATWDCAGGWHDDALAFIRGTGITDEVCFPYVDANCPPPDPNDPNYPNCGCQHWCSNAECSDRCDAWNKRLWQIDAVLNATPSVQGIKERLYAVGPVAVAHDWDADEDLDENGILRCNPDPPPVEYEHVVVISGWDDASGCWHIKNSWGADWNNGGYYKIPYNSCMVENLGYCASVRDPGEELFTVEDGQGIKIARFDSRGNVVIKGGLTEQGAPGSGTFYVQNPWYSTIASIASSGDMTITGSYDSPLCDAMGAYFLVEDASGATVSYIDNGGNLCVAHKLFQNP